MDCKGATKVLIIEDELLIAYDYKKMLEDAGMHGHIEPRGKDALKIATEQQFDVILLDLGLEDMCGIEVLRSLRRFGPHEQTPVIVISAHGEKALRQSVMDAQADLFLHKPANLDELLCAVFELSSVKVYKPASSN